jgi:hypothetical protein
MGLSVIYAASPVIRIKNLVERWPSSVRPSGEMRTRAILRLIFIAFKVDAELFAPVTSQAPQFDAV